VGRREKKEKLSTTLKTPLGENGGGKENGKGEEKGQYKTPLLLTTQLKESRGGGAFHPKIFFPPKRKGEKKHSCKGGNLFESSPGYGD